MTVLDSPLAADSANALDLLEPALRAHDGVGFVVGGNPIPEHGPVVCAIDASSGARSVARVGKAASDRLDADLVFAYVDPLANVERTPAGVRLRRSLSQLVGANARRVAGTADVEALTGEAPAGQLLLEHARERNARLLIVGSDIAGLRGLTDAPFPVIIVSRGRASGRGAPIR
jgi:nucleotide-binding universal stress UspA family protein